MAKYNAVAGQMRASLLRYSAPSALFPTLNLDGREGSGRTKLRGEHSAAAMRARLKLRVESVLSVAPKRRREKDCVIWTCWVGSLARDCARKMGSIRVAAVVEWKVDSMNCVVVCQ